MVEYTDMHHNTFGLNYFISDDHWYPLSCKKKNTKSIERSVPLTKNISILTNAN